MVLGVTLVASLCMAVEAVRLEKHQQETAAAALCLVGELVGLAAELMH